MAGPVKTLVDRLLATFAADEAARAELKRSRGAGVAVLRDAQRQGVSLGQLARLMLPAGSDEGNRSGPSEVRSFRGLTNS